MFIDFPTLFASVLQLYLNYHKLGGCDMFSYHIHCNPL